MNDEEFDDFFNGIDSRGIPSNKKEETPTPKETPTEPQTNLSDDSFMKFMDQEENRNPITGKIEDVVEDITEAKSPETVEKVVENNPEIAQEVLPDSPLKEEAQQINDGDERTDEVKDEAAEDFFNDFVESKDLKNSKNEGERRVGQFFDKYNKIISERHPYEAELIQNKIDNKIKSHRAGDRARDKWQEDIIRYEDKDNSRGQNNLVFDEAEKVLNDPTLFISRSKGLDLRDPAKRQFFRDKYGDEFVNKQDRQYILKDLRNENLSLAKDVMKGANFKPSKDSNKPRGMFDQLKRGEGKYKKRGEIAKGKHLDEIEGYIQSKKPGKNYGKVTKLGQRAMEAVPQIKENVKLKDAVAKNKDFDYSQWWTKDKKQLFKELTYKVDKADSLDELKEVQDKLNEEKTLVLDQIQDEEKTLFEPFVVENLEDVVEETGISEDELKNVEETLNSEESYIGETEDGIPFEIKAVEGEAPEGEKVFEKYEIIPYEGPLALHKEQLPVPYQVQEHFDQVEAKLEEKEEKIRKKYNLPKINFKDYAPVSIGPGGSVSGGKGLTFDKPNGIKSHTNANPHISGSPGGSGINTSAASISSLDLDTNNPSKASGPKIEPGVGEVGEVSASTKGNVYKPVEKKAGSMIGWSSVNKGAGRINTGKGKAPTFGSGSSGSTPGAKLKKVDSNNITRKSVSQKILSASTSWNVNEEGWKDSQDKYLPFRFFVKDSSIEVSILGTGRKRKSIESLNEQEIERVAKILQQ